MRRIGAGYVKDRSRGCEGQEQRMSRIGAGAGDLEIGIRG
jgi:hypothetical protein